MAVLQIPALSQSNCSGTRTASQPLGKEIHNQQVGIEDAQEQQLAGFLGWFSVGLGLAEVVAPRELARTIGVACDEGWIPLFGVREIASGFGILTQRRPAGALWSRVVGDVIDLAYLASAYGNPRNHRGRLAMATAAVAGVTILDILAAERHSRRPQALAHARRRSGEITVLKTISVNASQEVLYSFWRDFQNFPRFMRHLKQVEVLEGNRSRWIAHAPVGSSVEWEAEMTQDVPNQRIAWRTINGDVNHSGAVRFEPAPGGRGTEVRVELNYRPPLGALGSAVAWLLGEEPEFQIQEDLRKFKQIVETGEVPTTEGQPTGRGGRSLIPGF